jgi:2-methylcitrate dehydratase PrpD
MTVLTKLGEFLSSCTYEDIPDDVIKIVREHLLDSIGCAVAATNEPSIKVLERFVRSTLEGTGDSTIIGSDQPASLFAAALINGSKTDALEMADINKMAGAHPGATVIPAALVVAEYLKSSGKELLTALAIGYESQRVTRPLYPHGLQKGCHTAIISGTFGAAAVTGKLFGFNSETMINALGSCAIAPVAPSQPCNAGGYVKDLYTGWAARTGIYVAFLAKESFIGTPSLLDGELGLYTELEARKPAEEVISGLGEEWISRSSIIKPHSACRFTHSGADAILELNLDPEEIESINVTVASIPYNLTRGPKPEDSVAARFSIPYVMATALINKRNVLPSDFTIDAISNPRVLAVAEKIKIVLDKNLDADWPEAPVSKGHRTSILEVVLKNGKKLNHRVDYPKGDAKNPLTWGEITEKFLHLTKGYYSEKKAQQIIKLVEKIELLEDCRGFVKLLRGDEFIGV